MSNCLLKFYSDYHVTKCILYFVTFESVERQRLLIFKSLLKLASFADLGCHWQKMVRNSILVISQDSHNMPVSQQSAIAAVAHWANIRGRGDTGGHTCWKYKCADFARLAA